MGAVSVRPCSVGQCHTSSFPHLTGFYPHSTGLVRASVHPVIGMLSFIVWLSRRSVLIRIYHHHCPLKPAHPERQEKACRIVRRRSFSPCTERRHTRPRVADPEALCVSIVVCSSNVVGCAAPTNSRDSLPFPSFGRGSRRRGSQLDGHPVVFVGFGGLGGFVLWSSWGLEVRCSSSECDAALQLLTCLACLYRGGPPPACIRPGPDWPELLLAFACPCCCCGGAGGRVGNAYVIHLLSCMYPRTPSLLHRPRQTFYTSRLHAFQCIHDMYAANSGVIQ